VHRFGTKGSKLPDVVYSFACCSFRIPFALIHRNVLRAVLCGRPCCLLLIYHFSLETETKTKQNEMNASQ